MLRTLIALIALVTLIPHANAEPVKAGAELNNYVMKAQSNSDQSRSNLLSMTSGLPEPEASAADAIYAAATRADGKITQLFVATKIYTLMVDTRDMASVRSILNLLANHAINEIDASLTEINRNLVKLRAPAAVTEAQLVRNSLVEARDGLQKRTPLK